MSFWQETIKIGKTQYPRFMTAPIDGVTDSPMRQLIREFSPDILLFTEMRHVDAVANQKTEQCLKYDKSEHPIAFQVSANRTNFIDKAVQKILNAGFDQINLNAGCPAKRIVASGSGSALMANLPLLKEIITNLQASIAKHSDKQGARPEYFAKQLVATQNVSKGLTERKHIPLTLKIRAGFKEKNALEVALLAQDLGIDALIIHPRTQPEAFASPLDFELVKKIKENVKIPVIFSGNIYNFARAKKTYKLTGVDGFMVGRALYGTPWRIKQITEEAEGNTFEVSNKISLEYAIKHLDLASKHYGEQYGFNVFKKHIPLYIKNLENASQLRQLLLRSQSEAEMKKILEDLLKQQN